MADGGRPNVARQIPALVLWRPITSSFLPAGLHSCFPHALPSPLDPAFPLVPHTPLRIRARRRARRARLVDVLAAGDPRRRPGRGRAWRAAGPVADRERQTFPHTPRQTRCPTATHSPSRAESVSRSHRAPIAPSSNPRGQYDRSLGPRLPHLTPIGILRTAITASSFLPLPPRTCPRRHHHPRLLLLHHHALKVRVSL